MSNLVSINLVTHNRAKYLSEALHSVMAQTYSDWELIIIDDASSDNTAQILVPFLSDRRIRYYLVAKQKNIAAVRNLALAKSAGKYLAVLDSDDLWSSSAKLAQQVEFLERHQEVILVGTAAIRIDESGREQGRVYKPTEDVAIRRDWFAKNPFFHSSVMYRLAEAKKLGGYDENIRFGEDLDLWLRLGEVGQLYNLHEILIKYRTHQDNEAAKHQGQAIADVFKVIKKNRQKDGVGWGAFGRKIWNKITERRRSV
jgi:glycosyltransferase involved in cell wall biosynthesis